MYVRKLWLIIRLPHLFAIVWLLRNELVFFQKSLCNVTPHAAPSAHTTNLNISTRNGATKIPQKKLHCDFKRSPQCNQENTGQNPAPQAPQVYIYIYIYIYIWKYDVSNSLDKLYARVLSQMPNFTHFDKIFHRNVQ